MPLVSIAKTLYATLAAAYTQSLRFDLQLIFLLNFVVLSILFCREDMGIYLFRLK